MSEVFICRGGGGTGSGKPYPGAEKVLQSYLITKDQDWVVPNNIINNELSVTVVGGGGGATDEGSYWHSGVGGGGGWMNNIIVKIGAGSVIPIKVGKAGNNTSGGTTSFGVYASASGGSAASGKFGGNGGSGGYSDIGGIGYQFGGGGSNRGTYSGGGGGHGGVWGGGGGGGYISNGGNGGYYGGGGGAGAADTAEHTFRGGNGGYYGGGGGGYNNYGMGGLYLDNGTYKQSGFGGNGGRLYNVSEPENGTNTIGWTNVDKFSDGSYMTGNGIAGNTYKCKSDSSQNTMNYMGGGGGFGGNGGSGAYWNMYNTLSSGGGGGGGYGSRGGNTDGDLFNGFFGGGGGGYGGNGGSSTIRYRYYANGSINGFRYFSGGGGGYFANGGFGGGGYYCSSQKCEGGGVRLLNNVLGRGISVEYNWDTRWIGTNSTDGGCLIQFYQWL